MFFTLRAFWSQSFGLPTPPLTEKNLPDQTGKVYLISGSNTGVGYQVASILYSHNAKVWVAARSESKALEAIESIKREHPKSNGKLEYLSLNLSDLTTIKASAEDFLSREDKLHWLDNNAGVMVPPNGSKGAQGMDLTYQTNILGPFLFTKSLLPILRRTAENEPQGSVRVSWAGVWPSICRVRRVVRCGKREGMEKTHWMTKMTIDSPTVSAKQQIISLRPNLARDLERGMESYTM